MANLLSRRRCVHAATASALDDTPCPPDRPRRHALKVKLATARALVMYTYRQAGYLQTFSSRRASPVIVAVAAAAAG